MLVDDEGSNTPEGGDRTVHSSMESLLEMRFLGTVVPPQDVLQGEEWVPPSYYAEGQVVFAVVFLPYTNHQIGFIDNTYSIHTSNTPCTSLSTLLIICPH